MNERPILFSGEMVRAILEGRKTQTRRVEKFQEWGCLTGDCPHMEQADCDAELLEMSPYGVPGDRLWVREAFFKDSRDVDVVIYAATADFYRRKGEPVKPCTYPDTGRTGEYPTHESSLRNITTPPTSRWWKPKPSIHMPRWASRITLEITAVRVERLQDITNDDAIAEGCTTYDCGHPDCVAMHYGPRGAFLGQWNKLNAKRGFGWDTNPWVRVIEFTRVTP